LNVCSIRSNATTVRRTPKLARDDLPPSAFLGLQISGSSMVIQGDRTAVLQPVADLASTYFRRLADSASLSDLSGADSVGQPSIELT
jgi:hypothetical protein